MANRFFFVEHRSYSTRGAAALIHWSDVSSSGETGTWGDTMLVDCTPGTADFSDAGCFPGMSITLDAGTPGAPQQLTIAVGALNENGELEIRVNGGARRRALRGN